MTVKSARTQLERRGRSNGICVPLAIDSLLPVSVLPDEHYDLCSEIFHDPNGSHSKAVSYILKTFFGIEPQPSTDTAPVAKFNAFGASPQLYMPDVPYDYTGEKDYFLKNGVTNGQLRFVRVLEIARNNACSVLFTNNKGRNEHASGLHMVDEGEDSSDALYLVRDFVDIQGKRLFSSSELAGIPQTLGNAEVTNFTPLPSVQRPYFPDGQSSWELTILPPDPKI